MLMMLLGIVCFILSTGDVGCCLIVILAIILMLLRSGWLLSKNTWLQLNTSLMVWASRSCLLVGPIWVHLLAFKTLSQDCISQWVQGLSHLSSIAATQHYVAYAVLVHGFFSKLNYYLQTTPNINDLLSPLELAICQKFLTTMIPILPVI